MSITKIASVNGRKIQVEFVGFYLHELERLTYLVWRSTSLTLSVWVRLEPLNGERARCWYLPWEGQRRQFYSEVRESPEKHEWDCEGRKVEVVRVGNGVNQYELKIGGKEVVYAYDSGLESMIEGAIHHDSPVALLDWVEEKARPSVTGRYILI